MLALALAARDQNIVGTALPRLVSNLGGLFHLSWVVTSSLLALAWSGVANPWSSPLIIGFVSAFALLSFLLLRLEHRTASC